MMLMLLMMMATPMMMMAHDDALAAFMPAMTSDLKISDECLAQ